MASPRILPAFTTLFITLLGAGCSCNEGSGSLPDANFAGPRIDLLARRPDLVVETPGEVVPHGDIPGTATFGASEGPGWAKTDYRIGDGGGIPVHPGEGVPYRITNQAKAEIVLFATGSAPRDLVLDLWCLKPAGEAPDRVHLALNDVALAPEGLVVGLEPAELRVPTPAEAWQRGANRLELRVDIHKHGDDPVWDTLALARLRYGTPERATLDTAARVASLAPHTGVRYMLELASPARVELAGVASGKGKLHLRTGVMSPQSGELELGSGDAAVLESGGPEALHGTLDLALRAGEVRVLDLEWDSPAGATLSLETLEVRERAASTRPPIVFVSIDTFAAQHLGVYGYARANTPELDRLRQDAVLFERCIANAPWTLPSYLSVMSGLYPRSHLLALDFQEGSDIAPHDQWQLAENRWTLAEALRARGYRTGAFVDTYWLSPIFRVNQGFDNYNGEGAMGRPEDPHAHIEHIVTNLVPPWLATTDAEHPAFLFLHALDAHGPYLPDAPFRDTFTHTLGTERTPVPCGSINQTYGTMPSWMSRTMEPDEKKPEAPTVPLEEVVARYDESILKVDAFLGKLFAHLRERGLYDDAVIVVTGDHGEFFGPDAYGHGMMHESVLHVPLLLKLPKNAHGGERVRLPVALVDVYPTLLELAGAPVDGVRLHGTSLVARLGDKGDAQRPLFTESGHVEQYALTQGDWRLVEELPGSESSEASLLTHPRVPKEWVEANCPELLTRPLTGPLLGELLARPHFTERVKELRKLLSRPYYSLFDLSHDPREEHDLSESEPETLAKMKRALEAEKARSRAARSEAKVSGFRETLSPEAQDALEKLGYGGGSGH